jgi:hypothetical protein
MPRPSAAAAVSDDDERPSTRSARGTSARASKSKSKPPTPEPEPDADGEDDGEDGETEFEVEEIVNHKKKMFENVSVLCAARAAADADAVHRSTRASTSSGRASPTATTAGLAKQTPSAYALRCARGSG